jgi:hypothetical protein
VTPQRPKGPGQPGRPERAVRPIRPLGGEARGLQRPSRDEQERVRDMQQVGDLLPETARVFGLEEQLEQARLSAAWLRLIADRVPAADGSCRLMELRQDVATIEADMPIVAQEIRLRAPELLAVLRVTSGVAVRQLRVVTRHV